MASGVLLLPSVNRNFPRIVTQSHSGIIAYACRNNIYFVDARSNPPLVLDSKFIFGAHGGSIISLSYCKHETTELLASIGDDREMKIWDVESQTCVQSTTVKHCTRLAEWIYGSSNTLTYASDSRIITKWNIERDFLNGTRKVKTGIDMMVTQIVSNEKLPHLLAVGYITGSIMVMNIDQENVLHKLKIHSNEITSLSWSLVTPDTLLSASQDLSIRMWKMGEVQPIFSHYMHAGRQRHGDQKKIRIVAICHPKNSNTIICSNLRGDVGEIVFGDKEKPKFENEKSKFSYYYQGNCDLNCKSSFAFFLVSVEDGKAELLYCLDPFKLTVWDVARKRLVSQTPFMCQFVFDLTVSSLNPNLMAISNGEGILKVWNSQSEATRLDMVSVFTHFKTRIMTTAWHPLNENLIAYGTEEGRVGMIDIVKRKLLYSFETHHAGSVYCLGWGPCEKASKPESGKTEYYIYSVGGGVIYINKENNVKGKALNFDDLVEFPSDLDMSEKTYSEICWKSDYSCVCIGCYKGYIDIYDNKLLFLKRFNVQLKTVECLRWHPEITYISPQGSHLKSWLASSGNDTEIFIVDTSNISEAENASQGAIKKLVGHKKRVMSLCWSQHKDGFLVSASKDGSALVWDVLSGNIIATYLNHQDVVYAVQWSVFDEDVIYSGGQDSSVRVWKISQQKVLTISDKGPQRKKKLKKPSTDADAELQENSKVPTTDALASSNNEVNKKTDESPSKEPTVTESFSTKKTLFPHYAMSTIVNKVENVDDCVRLTDILIGNATADLDSIQSFESLKSSHINLCTDDIIKFGLFSDQLTALRMCETQGDLHKAAGDHNSNHHVQIMAGNMKTTIEEAAETRSLTHFLVAMAPSVSYSFWLEMCEKFAAQLAANHVYNQSSFYYLSCGKIYEAINVLAEKGYVVDALALAKSRLPETDPLIPKLVRRLIQVFGINSKVGKALCYLSLNDALSAAKVLASAGESNYVRVAVYICRKFNLIKEADEYRFLCMEKCLMKYDYSVFNLLVEKEPCMKVYSALVAVHEALSRHNQLLRKQDFVLYNLQEMFDFSENMEERCFWKGSSCKMSEQSFAVYVHLLMSKELMDTERRALVTILDALETFTATRMTVGTSDVHITIAVYITKFILLTLLEDTDAATEIFLKIFEAAHDIGLFPKIMWSLFFPMRLSWQINSSRITCSNIVTEEIENPALQSIQRKVAETITNYTKQPLETFITPNDLKNNLNFTANKISILLSITKVEEHLLAYFVSSFINDLMKLLEKRELNVKCHGFKSNVSIPSNLLESECILSNQSISEENGTIDCGQNDFDELIKLSLQEAEEKAKTISDQMIIETNDIISEVNVKSSSNDIVTSLADVIVQSVSQIKDRQSSTSVVNIASDETEVSKTHTTHSSNTKETDIYENHNNEISVKEVMAGENVNIANGSIIPELNIQDNECTIPSCDMILEEKLALNKEPLVGNNDIPKVDQTKDKNNSDVMVVSEICSNSQKDKNLNGATSSEEDLSKNETMKEWLQLFLSTKKDKECPISIAVPTPENDSANNEILTPIVVPSPEKNLSSHESPIPVAVPTPENDSETPIPVASLTPENNISNQENVTPIVAPTPENNLSNHERPTPVNYPTPEKDSENPILVAALTPENNLSNQESKTPIVLPTPENNLSNHGIPTPVNDPTPEKDSDSSIPVAEPTPEKDISNNERSASVIVPTAEKGLSNPENLIPVAALTPKKGLLHQGNPISIAINFEDNIQTNKQEISNIAFVPEDSNKNRILSDITTEIMTNGNSDPCVNEINHIQCLRNIQMFYNIVSFVAQSICKDEFALLYYLKEKFKLLSQIRASEELNKFSKEKKADAEAYIKKSKRVSSNLRNSALLKETAKQPEAGKLEALDEKVADPILNNNSEICVNVVNSIAGELNNVSIGFTEDENEKQDVSVMSPVTVKESTDKDLKLGDQNQEICANVVNSIACDFNVRIQALEDKIEELDVSKISSVTFEDGTNKDLKMGDQMQEICTNVVNPIVCEYNNDIIRAIEDEKKKLDGTEISSVTFEEGTNKDLELEDGDRNKEICANVVDSVADEVNRVSIETTGVEKKKLDGTEISSLVASEGGTDKEPDQDILSANISQAIDSIPDEVNSVSIQSTEDEKKKLGGTEISSLVASEGGTDKELDQDILNANISQEHNYTCQVESSKVADANLSQVICDVTGVVPSNLQNEIKEISELINVLEKNSEKFHYPNPFDVIPKMLKTLYIVKRKFACKVVQEKLHELIHEIISWTERYFVGDITFVCQVCRNKCVM